MGGGGLWGREFGSVGLRFEAFGVWPETDRVTCLRPPDLLCLKFGGSGSKPQWSDPVAKTQTKRLLRISSCTTRQYLELSESKRHVLRDTLVIWVYNLYFRGIQAISSTTG